MAANSANISQPAPHPIIPRLFTRPSDTVESLEQTDSRSMFSYGPPGKVAASSVPAVTRLDGKEHMKVKKPKPFHRSKRLRAQHSHRLYTSAESLGQSLIVRDDAQHASRPVSPTHGHDLVQPRSSHLIPEEEPVQTIIFTEDTGNRHEVPPSVSKGQTADRGHGDANSRVTDEGPPTGMTTATEPAQTLSLESLHRMQNDLMRKNQQEKQQAEYKLKIKEDEMNGLCNELARVKQASEAVHQKLLKVQENNEGLQQELAVEQRSKASDHNDLLQKFSDIVLSASVSPEDISRIKTDPTVLGAGQGG